MSEFKGNKGEWKISQEFDDKYNQPVFELRSKGICGICTIWSGQDKGQEMDEECKANAKLISCALEMLDMLIELNNFCTMKIEDRNKLEQLIKKATE